MKYIKKYLYPLLIAALSIVSFLLGVFLIIIEIDAAKNIILLSLLLAIIAFICGVIVLVKDIIRKDYVFKRYAANISTILLSVIIFCTLYLAHRIATPDGSKVVCGTHLSGLGKAISTYANDYDDYYPDCNQWCDLLILFEDAGARIFICDKSDAIIGESSYAMNINLNDKKLSQIEPNTVVLFDTIHGKDPNGRDVTVSSRYSYKVLKEMGEDIDFFRKNPEKQKVYEDRWNQSGGPEILTAENHNGQGANILFVDSHVEFIKIEDFNNLNWGNDLSEPNDKRN